jgi:hypothetical protein
LVKIFHFRMMAEGDGRIDQRGDEAWELVQALQGAEYFEAGRTRCNATRKKSIGMTYRVRDAEELGGCARFGDIEIRLALTNASDIFGGLQRFAIAGFYFQGCE